MAHPLRVRILAALDERTASPSDLADEVEAPLQNVSYHVRQLAASGLIELVDTQPRRGALEHYYRARPRRQVTDKAWAEVPRLVKEATVDAALGEVADHVREAVVAGGFDPDDVHLSRSQIVLDEQGWREVAEQLKGLVETVSRIQKESAARLAKAGGEGERAAALVAMLFESAPAGGGSGKGKKGSRGKDGAA